MVADEPVIKAFTLAMETRPTAVTRRDYDFEKPLLQLESGAKDPSPLRLELRLSRPFHRPRTRRSSRSTST
jgi:type VI secretion system secreted protein VgrG